MRALKSKMNITVSVVISLEKKDAGKSAEVMQSKLTDLLVYEHLGSYLFARKFTQKREDSTCTHSQLVLVNWLTDFNPTNHDPLHQVDGETRFEVLTSAKYQEPDSLPSSPASGKSRSRGESASDDEGWPEGQVQAAKLYINTCITFVNLSYIG